jgi:hypothetical protein
MSLTAPSPTRSRSQRRCIASSNQKRVASRVATAEGSLDDFVQPSQSESPGTTTLRQIAGSTPASRT